MSDQTATAETPAAYQTTEASQADQQPEQPEKTYTADMMSEVLLGIEPLKAYFETLEGCNENIALVGTTLCQKAERRIRKGFALIHDQIGFPEVTVACRFNVKAMEGEMLSCHLQDNSEGRL